MQGRRQGEPLATANLSRIPAIVGLASLGVVMREKKLRGIEVIAGSIRGIAVPGMDPKALIAAVKERHPEATKKEIARAAFLSVILSAEFDPKETQALHDLAVETRDQEI